LVYSRLLFRIYNKLGQGFVLPGLVGDVARGCSIVRGFARVCHVRGGRGLYGGGRDVAGGLMSSFPSLLHGQRGEGKPKIKRRGTDRRAQYRKIVVNLSTYLEIIFNTLAWRNYNTHINTHTHTHTISPTLSRYRTLYSTIFKSHCC
jgi:hypothetical protein